MRAHSQQRAFAAGSARWAWKVTKIKSYARQQREIERESERKHRQESVQRVERMRRFKDAGKEAQLRERNRECRAREQKKERARVNPNSDLLCGVCVVGCVDCVSV